jgi:hypothetical protein
MNVNSQLLGIYINYILLYTLHSLTLLEHFFNT